MECHLSIATITAISVHVTFIALFSRCLCNQTRNSKADVVGLECRRSRIMSHRGTMKRTGAPRTASHDGIACLAGTFVDAALFAPLPDVAEHVVEAESVRLEFR